MYSIIINSNNGNKTYKDFNNKKIYKIKEGTINLTNNLYLLIVILTDQ